MIRYGQIGATTKQSVTSSDTSWKDPGMPNNTNASGAMWYGSYVIVADQAIHFDVLETASQDTSPYLPAKTPVQITLRDQDVLHFTLASGSTPCSLWITKKF